MAEQGNDTPRRYEETTEPQNPPNSVLSKDARRAAVLSYFVPVVVLFAFMGIALVYWSNQPKRSQAGDGDRAEIGTVGRTDGGTQPEPRLDNPSDEIKYRGGDLVPISQVSELRDLDARQMTGRRVSIAEAQVDSASGNTMFVRDDDRTFAVIVPEGAPVMKSGMKVSIAGHVAADGKGAPQIVADRIQVKS